MNTLNEVLSTMVCPPVVATSVEYATKKDIEAINERLDAFRKDFLSKKDHDLGNHLRLNRPLKWKYNWRGEKKYAVLGKERLEYWRSHWKEWMPFYTHEGEGCTIRMPV
jgi:hypothetical protein